MKRTSILLIVVTMLLTFGCETKTGSTENPAGTTAPAGNPLAKTNWRVESYGAADNQQPLKRDPNRSEEFQPKIEFGDQSFGGRIAGCNIISYDYTVEGSKIKTKSLSSTVMACAEDVMRQEEELKKAFEKAETFRLDGDRLEIIYDGAKTIRLTRLKAGS